MTDNESWMDQFANEGDTATVVMPEETRSPSDRTDTSRPSEKTGGLRRKFRNGKGKPPKPVKEKASKQSRTGPSFGQRAASASKRFGASLTMSFVEYVTWAGVASAVLFASNLWLLWRHPMLLHHLSRGDVAVGAALGLVLNAVLFRLALQARWLHRRSGPWTSLLAGLVWVVIVAAVVVIFVEFVKWWPSVVTVSYVFLACTGLAYHSHRNALRSADRQQAKQEAVDELASATLAVQQRLMEAGTVLEHAKSVSDSTTATQVKVNEAIPQLQETINTTLKSVESAKSSALTIRTKRQDQVDEVNALVSKMHDEDVENRLKAANREHADFIEQQKQQAADEARTMKDGEIAQLKDRHGAALQEQADRHRTEKDALERQIQELEGNLAAYRQGTDPYGNQPPIGPVGTNPAAVPLYVTDDGTVISPPRQR